MGDQTQKEESWLLVRLVHLIKQFPFVVFCVWMGWRDIQRESKQDLKDLKREVKEEQREKFDHEMLIYYRDAKMKELELKEVELSKKYEKDTINTK